MNVDRCFVGLVICAILRVLSFDSMAGNRNQFECDELVTQENPHNINGVRILRGVADKFVIKEIWIQIVRGETQ